MSILDQIKEAIQNTDGDDTVELNLSELEIGQFTPEIKKAIEKCKNLELLILNNCGLTSLDNLPELSLQAIDLTANKLGDQELAKLAKCKTLGQIILNENNITKLDSIKALAKLQHLQEIDFTDNPVTQQPGYKLPQLEVLDRFDRDGNQQQEQPEFQDDEDSEEEDQDDDGEFDDDEDQQSEESAPKKKKK